MSFLKCLWLAIFCFCFLEGIASSWALEPRLPQQEDLDPEDNANATILPVSRGWTAFGDSYAAGIGAGGIWGAGGLCRRRLGSYPSQLNSSPLLAADENHEFQFIACSGATTARIIPGEEDSQIDAFVARSVSNKDIATISIGGNDVGFKEVLDACIVDWSFFGPSCESALQTAGLAIAGIASRLVSIFNYVLEASQNNGGPSEFKLYVTGYPQFFNAETTDCDNYSFGFWSSRIKLTRDRRGTINSLVRRLNGEISTAVDVVNSQWQQTKVVFVDYDSFFEGHRFCEEGVVEPDGNNPNTWFFLINGQDSPGFDVPETDQPVDLSPEQCDTILHSKSGDWGEYAICAVQAALARDSTLRPEPWTNLTDGNFVWVPENYGKMFHPKTGGYTAVVQAIEGALNKTESGKVVEVLIMIESSADEFSKFIATLPSAEKDSRRIEQEGVDIRGYVTSLPTNYARNLTQTNPIVVGVSFPPRSDDENDIEESEMATRELENITSLFGDTHTTIPLNKRQITDTDLNMRFFSHWHLNTISKPPVYSGTAYWEYPSYIYDPSGGSDVTIYTLDTGINTQHTEFENKDLSRSFVPFGINDITDYFGHGTCIASLAAGRAEGVAGAATIVPVKYHSGRTSDPANFVDLRADSLFECLLWIYHDVVANKRGKAVINFSTGIPAAKFVSVDILDPTDDDIDESDPWFTFLPKFEAIDAVVVTSVGNGASVDDGDSKFESPRRYAAAGEIAESTLIVVGGTNQDNTRYERSNLFPSVLTTYAPAHATCANFDTNSGYKEDVGTSLSAAMTSGIIATYLARADLESTLQIPGSVARSVKIYLQQSAAYSTDSNPNGNPPTLDVIGSMNYVPCTDTSTSTKRSEPNVSLWDWDGLVKRQNFASTPIRTSTMLLTIEAGAKCTGFDRMPVNNFKYVGCFEDQSNPARILRANYQQITTMTLESCADYCKDYQYFGVEYGNQCYCDDIAYVTTRHSEVQCNMDCAGNNQQICGASWKMNLYGTSGKVGGPFIGTVNGWNHVHCMYDGISRTLDGKYTQITDMTPSNCAEACSGFTYFGLEFGDQCYCGNSISNINGGNAPGSDCNMPCGGDSNSICGNAWRANVYQREQSTPQSGNQVQVWYEQFCNEANCAFSWDAWLVRPDGPYNICEDRPDTEVLDAPAVDFGENSWLQPTSMSFSGDTMAGCEYTASSGDQGAPIGMLSCPSFSSPIQCSPLGLDPQDCSFLLGVKFYPIFYCEW